MISGRVWLSRFYARGNTVKVPRLSYLSASKVKGTSVERRSRRKGMRQGLVKIGFRKNNGTVELNACFETGYSHRNSFTSGLALEPKNLELPNKPDSSLDILFCALQDPCKPLTLRIYRIIRWSWNDLSSELQGGEKMKKYLSRHICPERESSTVDSSFVPTIRFLPRSTIHDLYD